MAGQWYYGWGKHKFGPFTETQLMELAEQGKLQPMDTVWKEGTDNGIPALQVKNLFPEMEEDAPAAAEGQRSESESVAAVPSEAAEPKEPTDFDSASAAPSAIADSNPSATPKYTQRKGRAVAVKGAIIISQDGERVQFRKKCLRCGYEDASKSGMPIRNGTTRARFFCPKCRKAGEVIIQGIV